VHRPLVQYRTETRRLVSARITPLRLEGFRAAPEACASLRSSGRSTRDPRGPGPPRPTRIRKKSLVSMVMLEWGTCGQVATPFRMPQ